MQENSTKKILFVCTGNTCRSPMAEAVFNHKAKSKGLNAVAFSRGLFAEGSPISENAKTALSEGGFEIGEHISTTVSQKDIKDADIVIGITGRHTANLIVSFPEYKHKIRSLPNDIMDPFGGDIEIYKSVLADICTGVEEIINTIGDMSGDSICSGIILEHLCECHIDGMERIENECFSEPWSRKSLEELTSCEYAVYFVARDTKNDAVAGYCGMYVSLDTGAINNIGVLKEYRRCGIASKLLGKLISYSKENGVSLLTLEVRESNIAARTLYEKFGFQEVGVRKNYYKKPCENGILYNKQIT